MLQSLACMTFIILSSSYLFGVPWCNQPIHWHPKMLALSWMYNFMPPCLCASCAHPPSPTLRSPPPWWISHPEDKVNHSSVCPQITMSKGLAHFTAFDYHCISNTQHNDQQEYKKALAFKQFSLFKKKKNLSLIWTHLTIMLSFLDQIGWDASHISYFLTVYFCFSSENPC